MFAQYSSCEGCCVNSLISAALSTRRLARHTNWAGCHARFGRLSFDVHVMIGVCRKLGAGGTRSDGGRGRSPELLEFSDLRVPLCRGGVQLCWDDPSLSGPQLTHILIRSQVCQSAVSLCWNLCVLLHFVIKDALARHIQFICYRSQPTIISEGMSIEHWWPERHEICKSQPFDRSDFDRLFIFWQIIYFPFILSLPSTVKTFLNIARD